MKSEEFASAACFFHFFSLSQLLAGFLNDEINALCCGFVREGYIDIWVDAEFSMLFVTVVHGAGREADAPAVGQRIGHG